MIVIIEGIRWNTNSPFLKLTPLSVSFSFCIYLTVSMSRSREKFVSKY